MPDIVKVRNLGKEPLRLGYNSQVTVIPPKGEGFIEREAAVIHFGNPNLRDNPMGHHPDEQRARTMEYHRIRGIYGASIGYEGADGLWEENKPSVEVSEVSGEKWITVIEDPSGQSLPISGMPEPDKEAVLESMTKQIQELREEIARQKSMPMAVPDEDRPSGARRRREPVIEPVHDE